MSSGGRSFGLVCVLLTSAGSTGCDADDDDEIATGELEDGQGPGGSDGLGDGDGDNGEPLECSRLDQQECDVALECTIVWGDAYVPYMDGWCAPDAQEFLACVRAQEVCEPLDSACSDDYPGVVYRTYSCVPGFEPCGVPGPVTFGCEP